MFSVGAVVRELSFDGAAEDDDSFFVGAFSRFFFVGAEALLVPEDAAAVAFEAFAAARPGVGDSFVVVGECTSASSLALRRSCRTPARTLKGSASMTPRARLKYSNWRPARLSYQREAIGSAAFQRVSSLYACL